jgi:hypothetical protein
MKSGRAWLARYIGPKKNATAEGAVDHWLSQSYDFLGAEDIEKLIISLDSVTTGAIVKDKNPFLRANSVRELCSFHDVDFVRCAYVTLLGRQPDPSGEAHHLERLRDGRAQLAILRDLRTSPEGQLHDPGIAGLDRALKRHHNANRKYVGWMFRMFTNREGSSSVERRLRVLENDMAIMASEHGVATAQILQRFDLLATRMNRAASQASTLSEGVAPVRSMLEGGDLGGVSSGAAMIDGLRGMTNQSSESNAFLG